MKTLNFTKFSVFIFIFVIFNFKVLSFNLPSVSAQSRLTYPISDLGYCRDAKECYLYCGIPENKAACWSYSTYKLNKNVLGDTTMSVRELQLMESKARQYNITFPIADLGNCAGPQECRDFCEQSTNQQMCMDFAKKKGFQKETKSAPGVRGGNRDELMQKAQTELGCTSMESCSKICETDQNRCEAFAKKHGVYQEPPQTQKRYSTEEKMQLMQKAQTELGCTSMESCKSICEKNPQACMEFSKKHGFDKQQESRGQNESDRYQPKTPSGAAPNYGIARFGSNNCDNEESCKQYCQKHPNECPGFQGFTRATEGGSPSGQQMTKNKDGSYVGPSGCRTETECKNWCTDHPDKCPGFSEAKSREELYKREYENRKKQNEVSREILQKQSEYQNTTSQQPNGYRSSNEIHPESGGGSYGGSIPLTSPGTSVWDTSKQTTITTPQR